MARTYAVFQSDSIANVMIPYPLRALRPHCTCASRRRLPAQDLAFFGLTPRSYAANQKSLLWKECLPSCGWSRRSNTGEGPCGRHMCRACVMSSTVSSSLASRTLLGRASCRRMPSTAGVPKRWRAWLQILGTKQFTANRCRAWAKPAWEKNYNHRGRVGGGWPLPDHWKTRTAWTSKQNPSLQERLVASGRLTQSSMRTRSL